MNEWRVISNGVKVRGKSKTQGQDSRLKTQDSRLRTQDGGKVLIRDYW